MPLCVRDEMIFVMLIFIVTLIMSSSKVNVKFHGNKRVNVAKVVGVTPSEGFLVNSSLMHVISFMQR